MNKKFTLVKTATVINYEKYRFKDHWRLNVVKVKTK